MMLSDGQTTGMTEYQAVEVRCSLRLGGSGYSMTAVQFVNLRRLSKEKKKKNTAGRTEMA